MATTTPRQAAATGSHIAGWLTPNEFAILEAVCDTLLPPLEPPAGSSEAIAAYYRGSARDLNVAHLVAETLALENPRAQTEFRQLLALLASPAAGLARSASNWRNSVCARGFSRARVSATRCATFRSRAALR